MSKIIQLQDAGGNNVLPVGFNQGGCKLDLLWTNPNPTANQGKLVLDIDSSQYELFIVQLKNDNVENGVITTTVVKNTPIIVLITNTRTRSITITDSAMTFERAKQGTTEYDNIGSIIKVYGLKMSYIVPTEVQGLQYTEDE